MDGRRGSLPPSTQVLLFDLGFAASQLSSMVCWRNVQLERFPFAKYPKHVEDCSNYAFKAAAIHEALLRHKAAIWIDSGLELRAPMDRWAECGEGGGRGGTHGPVGPMRRWAEWGASKLMSHGQLMWGKRGQGGGGYGA